MGALAQAQTHDIDVMHAKDFANRECIILERQGNKIVVDLFYTNMHTSEGAD